VELYVTARDSRISDEMKEYIKEKIMRIEKLSHKIVDVHVILDFQRYLFIAEVNANTNLAKINCKEADEDMFAAIDTVIDKIERQMRKIKEKIQNHHAKLNNKIMPAGVNEEENYDAEQLDEYLSVIEEDISLKDMSLQDAINHLDVLHDPFILFIKSDNSKKCILCKGSETKYELFERKDIKGEPVFIEHTLEVDKTDLNNVMIEVKDKKEITVNLMSILQATEKLRDLKKEFVAFVDNESNTGLFMVFYRKDGKFGLIKLES